MIGSATTFTPQWLETALQLERGSIDRVDVQQVGTGQVASSYRITIAGSSSPGPASVIAKGPSVDPVSRATGMSRGLYRREVDWYRAYAAQTRVRCPDHLYSECSDDGAFVLLLEDCAPAQQGDQLAGSSIAHIQAAVREAANLHGAFLQRPDVLDALRPPSDGAVLSRRVDLFHAGWAAFRERSRGRLAPELLLLGDLFDVRYERYAMRRPGSVTIVHKDFRIDNMLFVDRNDRIVILDWQTYGLGHPMEDVAYLVGTSVCDPAERLRHERRLVEQYCTWLAEWHPDVDLDQYWDEYRVHAFSGFVMAVISSSLVARTERGDEMFAVMAERAARQALDLDSLSLLT